MMPYKRYITFGDKYRHRPHERLSDVTPDGYILVLANNEDEWRKAATLLTGGFYAASYTAAPSWCHQGCIGLFNFMSGSAWHPEGEVANYHYYTPDQEEE